MNTKHYDEIAIGEVLNGNTVTSKSTYVDRDLIRDSGCGQDEATTYTLFFNGETKRRSQFKDSVSGYFFF